MKTIQIRLDHASLSGSVASMKEIPATVEAIGEYLKTRNSLPFSDEDLKTLKVTHYYGQDIRLGWKIVYCVTVNGNPVAFTNGSIEGELQ